MLNDSFVLLAIVYRIQPFSKLKKNVYRICIYIFLFYDKKGQCNAAIGIKIYMYANSAVSFGEKKNSANIYKN